MKSLFLSLRFLVFLCGCLFVVSACSHNLKPPIEGAVATVHPIATQAAEAVFSQGGNAVDAAVAAALTLGVVDGHNSGIGGGCFVVIHWTDGRIEAIDGREMAPALATRDMYLREGVVVPALSKTGALAIGVPGSLAAYNYLLKEGGNFNLADLLLPAAQIAEQGFNISDSYASRLAKTAPAIRQLPESAALLLNKSGESHKAGFLFKQPDLANTYRNIAEQGVDYFYKGTFSLTLEQWMQTNDGLLTADDFANYQLKKRQPLLTEYRGYQLAGFPPPSSGGVHVAQILNILEGFDLAGLSDAGRYHVIAEAMKLAFADRAYWLGDPDFVGVPRGLINKEYAAQLAKKIDLERVIAVPGPGMPPAADYDLFGKHTTHIATADKEGNWVAITTTVNTSFGSKVIIPGTGVIMNNQMDDFSAQPGVQNAFGLVGAEANSIAPGKRPLSSMSPTIVLKDGKPVMTLGSAGGPTIITQVVQALINVIDLGMSPQEAVAAPRIHHQWLPDKLFVEQTTPSKVQANLQKGGHTLKIGRHRGATQFIGLTEQGKFIAVSEPRLIIINPN
jgi:gamma-glutamyltranspeptidase / glutathione hydrolase